MTATFRVRCPMGDWAQVAPDRETGIHLMVRHANGAHTIGDPNLLVIARCDAKLDAAGCPYIPPAGQYVP